MALQTITQANLDSIVAASQLFWKSGGREGYKASLSGYDFAASAVTFSWPVLNCGTFTKSDFHGINITGAVFKNADCRFANFKNCNLTSADFSGSDCYGADFTGANLTKVDFSGTGLGNAILTGSTQSGTRFDNAWMVGTVL